MKKGIILLIFQVNLLHAQTVSKPLPQWQQLRPAVRAISLVMMHDVTSPPVAARYYAYCMLGAYHIVSMRDTSIPALSAFISSYPSIRLNAAEKKFDHRIAALYCIMETGRQMLPSGFMLKEKQDEYIHVLKKNKIGKAVIDQSILVAVEMADKITAYAATDSYNKLSTKLRYTPLRGDGYWYPTPPAYMEAIEPNWKIIRPMIMDSAEEFRPRLSIPFSSDSTSEFYKLAREVYDVSKQATPEQSAIANFWDCNPFAVSSSGHMAIGFKKITPGGHWMNISSIACEKAGLDFDHSVILQTIEAITLMDGFISSWDEKYRSNRIRPETFINRHIDPHWQPLLQTPPFPEYTSAHSVISTASAEVLSYLLGDDFAFTDDSEMIFGIPERSFHSFRHAADEASISRLYGGIHYRDSILNGQEEGRAIAKKIIDRIKAAGILPLNGRVAMGK